jgi:hypothetical protein
VSSDSGFIDRIAMLDERRAAKTRETMRRGGLPPATEHTREVAAGDDRACDGCGETIHAGDALHTVSVWTALYWRFHESCFEAWRALRHA